MRAPRLAPALLAAAACVAPPAPVVETEGLAPVGADALFWRAAGPVGAPSAEPAVVLVGGGALDLRQWDHQVAGLSGAFRVVRYDHRGWGRSSGPSEPYAPHEDLAALLDALALDDVVLVGSSYGGGVALDCALEHPDRVRALVLVAPAIGGYPWPESFFARQRRFAQVRERDGAKAFARAIVADPHFVPTAASDPALALRVEELLRENDRVHDLDPSLYRPMDPPAFERLPGLETPTLVLVGALDDPDVRAAAEHLVRAAPGAEGAEVPGCGHLVHMEAPEVFDEAVAGFLRALPSR